MITETERRVLNELEEMRGEITELLSNMVKIPTVNPPGEYEELVSFLDERLRLEGLETEIIEVPQKILAKHNVSVPKYNFLGKLRGSSEKPTIYLNAHLDTVSPECIPGDMQRWTVPPFAGVVKDDRVWGRGACDAKGRLAAYLAVAIAMKRAGIKLEGNLVVAATADEENGLSAYTGAGYLASIGKLNGDFAIVEGFTDYLYMANAGEIALSIKTFGDSLHTSEVLDGGVNANHTMIRVLSELTAYQEELKKEGSRIPGLGYTVINVGLIEGGMDWNMTASACVARVAIAPVPEHDPDHLIRQITGRMDRLRRENPDWKADIEVDWAIPAVVTAAIKSPLVLELKNAAMEIFEQDLKVTGLSGRTDIGFFVDAGMEAVNYGPARWNESNLHLPDENVRIQDLINTSQIISIAAIRLMQGKNL